tara:strand:+ start:144 stop:644 length:501 start_codon:yes stop_codon:yes gene_type:complete
MTNKKYAKKTIIVSSLVIAGIIIVSLWYTGNATGFCYAEFRYLSDRELIDRYLEQTNAIKTDAAGVEKYLHSTNKDVYAFQYPECCRVLGVSEQTIPLFGWDVIEISMVYPDYHVPPDTKEPYYQGYMALTSCGKIRDGTGSISIKKERYEFTLEQNAKYWKELEE